MTMTTTTVWKIEEKKTEREIQASVYVCVHAQKAIITIHIAQSTDHSLWLLLLWIFSVSQKQCTIAVYECVGRFCDRN